MKSEREPFGSGLKRALNEFNPFNSKKERSGKRVMKQVHKFPLKDQKRIFVEALILRYRKEGRKIEEKGLPFQLISDTGKPDVLVRIVVSNGLLSESFPVSRTAIESADSKIDGKRTFLRAQVILKIDDKSTLINIPSNRLEQEHPGWNIGHIVGVDADHYCRSIERLNSLFPTLFSRNGKIAR